MSYSLWSKDLNLGLPYFKVHVTKVQQSGHEATLKWQLPCLLILSNPGGFNTKQWELSEHSQLKKKNVHKGCTCEKPIFTNSHHTMGNQPGNYRFSSGRKVYVSSCFEICLIISTAMKTMFYFLLSEQASHEALFLQGLTEFFLCEPKKQNRQLEGGEYPPP